MSFDLGAGGGRHAFEAMRLGAVVTAVDADPWNHVEAAMALVVAGRVAEAEAAYAWLASTQLADGS
ncbi:MAG: hypothetical protein ACR2MN_11985 [Acidimicrobiales bacterium]